MAGRRWPAARRHFNALGVIRGLGKDAERLIQGVSAPLTQHLAPRMADNTALLQGLRRAAARLQAMACT